MRWMHDQKERHVLGPFDCEHQVIVTKTVEGFDGLLTILPVGGGRFSACCEKACPESVLCVPVYKRDKGKASRETSVPVFGKEDTLDGTKPPAQLPEVFLVCVLRQIGDPDCCRVVCHSTTRCGEQVPINEARSALRQRRQCLPRSARGAPALSERGTYTLLGTSAAAAVDIDWVSVTSHVFLFYYFCSEIEGNLMKMENK